MYTEYVIEVNCVQLTRCVGDAGDPTWWVCVDSFHASDYRAALDILASYGFDDPADVRVRPACADYTVNAD